jgi:hypothetical protein
MYYKELLKNLDDDLYELIRYFGVSKSSEIIARPVSDVSMWMNDKRNWTTGKKIIIHDALLKEKQGQ